MDKGMRIRALFHIDPPSLLLLLFLQPFFSLKYLFFRQTFILTQICPHYFIPSCSPSSQVSHKSHQEGGQHATNGEDRHRQRPVHDHGRVISRLWELSFVCAVFWQDGSPLRPHLKRSPIMLFNDLWHRHAYGSSRGTITAATSHFTWEDATYIRWL